MRLRTLATTAAATATTAAVGAAASSSGARSPWYASLDRPPFQPPPAAFPLVWTVLYADLAVASAATVDALAARRPGGERPFRRSLAANLVLNASWTWVFFRAHRLPAATVVAGLLTASSGDLARRARATGGLAGPALVPYAAWCGFATVLSAALWRRNR